MAIARLIICQWRGTGSSERVVAQPTLDEVEAAVGRLDNRNFNDLYLQPAAKDNETYLCVGGGAGRYILAGSVGNERFPTLTDPQRLREPAELVVVGGQEGEYPRNGDFDDQNLAWVDR
jgi:hypothetical protein